MKAIHYIISLLAAVTVAVSCEKERRLTGLPGEPLIFVKCLPGTGLAPAETGDATLAPYPELQQCFPLAIHGFEFEAMLAKAAGAKDANPPAIYDSRTTFRINEEQSPLAMYTASSPGNPYSRKAIYVSAADLLPGDRMSLDMSLDGVRPVHAEATVPEYITGIRVRIEDIDDNLTVSISIPDDPAAEEFFAVEMFLKKISTNIETGVENSPYITPIPLDLPDAERYPDLANSGTLMKDENLYVFSDSGSQNGWRNVNLQENHPHDEEDKGYIDKYFYQIVCYRLSPEYFYYFRSRYEVDNNFLGMIGFAPGIFAYSNVSGGIGAMGVASASATGWIPNTEVKMN